MFSRREIVGGGVARLVIEVHVLDIVVLVRDDHGNEPRRPFGKTDSHTFLWCINSISVSFFQNYLRTARV